MEYTLLVISAIIIPLIFLHIVSYHLKEIYYLHYKNNNIKVIKDSYYSLQLLFCIITCVLLVFESVIAINNILFFYMLLYSYIFIHKLFLKIHFNKNEFYKYKW